MALCPDVFTFCKDFEGSVFAQELFVILTVKYLTTINPWWRDQNLIFVFL